jgi:hypothetical protein
VDFLISYADDQRILRYCDSDVLAGSWPPHFHALYAEHEALIDLRDFSVIRGSLPRRAMALVLEWATDHREELMEDWNLCSRMQTPRAIEPLK